MHIHFDITILALRIYPIATLAHIGIARHMIIHCNNVCGKILKIEQRPSMVIATDILIRVMMAMPLCKVVLYPLTFLIPQTICTQP